MEILGENIQLMKMTYVPQSHTFDVECIFPNHATPEIKRLNYRNFPDHKPFKILNGVFHINQEVHVWIKDSVELKSEGWDFLTPKGKTLASKKHPFTIGKKKGGLLGSKGLKGFIGVSEKMRPYVVVNSGDSQWRFTEAELRFILPIQAHMAKGKTTNFKANDGCVWTYDKDNKAHVVKSPNFTITAKDLTELINLLRKAEVI